MDSFHVPAPLPKQEVIRKATERAKGNLVRIPLREGRTLHHDVLGHYGESEEAFLEAIASSSGAQRYGSHVRLANLYVNMGRFEGAIEACNAAAEWADENDDLYLHAGAKLIGGNALLYQGHWDRCIDSYEEAVDLGARSDSDDAMAAGGPRGNLGWALGCVGRYREAMAHSTAATALLNSARKLSPVKSTSTPRCWWTRSSTSSR